jgi:hypothetical protein
LPTPLVKKSFFGTMLFPNFYVASVGFEVDDFGIGFPKEFIAFGLSPRCFATNSSAVHTTP